MECWRYWKQYDRKETGMLVLVSIFFRKFEFKRQYVFSSALSACLFSGLQAAHFRPISFRNQPVGCTATILYEMYGEQKLEISPNIAGLLCAAIISDTLMFRSPTCTLSDKMAAGALALIAGINIEQFAREMFKAGSNLKDKSPEEIFYQDYKKFIAEDEISFGVGQISSMDSDELTEIKERLIPFMVSECGRHGVSRVFFMLTNIIEESTELLYYGEGSEEMASTAFHMEPTDGVFDLKGVVSRKKQLIPALMEAAQAGQNDYN